MIPSPGILREKKEKILWKKQQAAPDPESKLTET
jgi:hypothetical protein